MTPDGSHRCPVARLKAGYYRPLCSFSASKNELSLAGAKHAGQHGDPLQPEGPCLTSVGGAGAAEGR